MAELSQQDRDQLAFLYGIPGEAGAHGDKENSSLIDSGPGVLSGIPSAAWGGFSKGVTRGTLTGADLIEQHAAKPVLQYLYGTDKYPDASFGGFKPYLQYVDEERPDPRTTGAVGQLLFGVAQQAGEMAPYALGALATGGSAGIAGVVGMATTEGEARTRELESRGVDAATATESGLLTGAANLAGGMLPGAIGASLLKRIASGAAINTGFGVGQRALDHTILDDAGYHQQAAQQKWNDGMSIAADAIMGSLFGAIHPQSGERRPTPDQVDASLVAKDNEHITSKAPGVPADPKSASAHVDALDTAMDQLADGQPVSVDAQLRGAKFVERPEVMGEAEQQSAMRDALIDDGHSVDDVDLADGTKAPMEPVSILRGDELADEVTPENAVEVSRQWFKDNLQGKVVSRPGFGDVKMTGRGFAKIRSGLRINPDRARLIPAIPHVIRNGSYDGRRPIYKERTDRFVAFHSFSAPVRLGNEVHLVRVLAGEDDKGHLLYSLYHEKGPSTEPENIAREAEGPLTKLDPPAEPREVAEERDGPRSKTLSDSEYEVNIEAHSPSRRAEPTPDAAKPDDALGDFENQEIARTRAAADAGENLSVEDPDSGKQVSAADYLDGADGEHAEAKKFADSIRAAVSCFLSYGDDV